HNVGPVQGPGSLVVTRGRDRPIRTNIRTARDGKEGTDSWPVAPRYDGADEPIRRVAVGGRALPTAILPPLEERGILGQEAAHVRIGYGDESRAPLGVPQLDTGGELCRRGLFLDHGPQGIAPAEKVLIAG